MKTRSVVLTRAHRLAKRPVEDMLSILLSFGSRIDLRVLGAGLAICRTRGEKAKARILARKIRQMRQQASKHEKR